MSSDGIFVLCSRGNYFKIFILVKTWYFSGMWMSITEYIHVGLVSLHDNNKICTFQSDVFSHENCILLKHLHRQIGMHIVWPSDAKDISSKIAQWVYRADKPRPALPRCAGASVDQRKEWLLHFREHTCVLAPSTGTWPLPTHCTFLTPSQWPEELSWFWLM